MNVHLNRAVTYLREHRKVRAALLFIAVGIVIGLSIGWTMRGPFC